MGKKFTCKSEAQKKAIRASYARRSKQQQGRRVEAPYPHFRYYNKSKHPALIVGEQTGVKTENGRTHEVEEYKYRKVMHGEKDGGRKNEKVEPNPDPTDNEPMYIGKRVRHDDKNNFELKPLPWKYHKK